MLQEENRLKKVRDFNLVFKYGRWQRGRILDLKYLELAKKSDYFPKKVDKEEFAKQLKLAFTVGLKVDKRATVRNRLRRKMRESVRLLVKDGRLKRGYYILLAARKESLEKNFNEIKEEIELLLRRAGIFS